MARPTRFAANNEPMHIFQDNFDFFEQPAPSISRAPMPSVGRQPPSGRPLQDSNRNVVLNPPNGHGKQHSPFKATGRATASPLTPLRSSHGNMSHGNSYNLNPVSILPPTSNGQSTDSMLKRQPSMSRFKTVVQKPNIMDMQASFEKENFHPTYLAQPAFSLNVDGFYPQKTPGKRALLEAAPIKDSRPPKRVRTEEPCLPLPSSFPLIVDDGTKPGHSYAQLIGMAILRAPNRRLTLSQIYKWISDTYSFYSAHDAGWQNSIRHNLSLNKAFIKQERPKDDPGKGNYWAIETGMEQQFMKEKPSRKSAAATENMQIMSMGPRLDFAHLEPTTFHDGLPPSLPPVLCAQTSSYQQPGPPQAPAHSAPEVSSDATIPLSDNVGPEEQEEASQEQNVPLETPLETSLYSPPAAMQSSPPIPRHLEHRSNTPPPIMREAQSSASHKPSHKRKHASMDAPNSIDDSGYISSLESSAMRPNQVSRVQSSETDRPRGKKRGRAEEEIARLRASSCDSPTKSRSYGFVPPSSSPIRQPTDGQMLPPLTPGVKDKPTQKIPPSVSPNTNLQIHRDNVRQLLNSPLRRVSNISDEVTMPWSPAFNMDEETFIGGLDFRNTDIDFSIYTDESIDNFHTASYGSPVKRSAKRPRLDRTQSASALGDTTGTSSNRALMSTPYLKAPTPRQDLGFESPSKVFEGMSSPLKRYFQSPSVRAQPQPPIAARDEWNNFENLNEHTLFEDEVELDIDIFQGFAKISGSENASGPAKPPPPRPSFGRSYTSTL
ncbi:Uu.00g004700.m01.CDS01 [Anthostomella pinea]|uniref:Uu.00g004700.m01.CDS01 n=1 Tax=Anthostomella pinea TaxID=933095 RepID=A0AAI8VL50_9PEZI|nr:Uu.00g004700.m01.CDS01 [Anthostomella pinea]